MFFLLAAASAAMLASCSSELDIPANGEGAGVVTFTAQLPGAVSRTFGDGNAAKILKYAVYQSGTKTPLAVHGSDALYGTKEIPANTASVNISLSLAEGKTYDIVFWADAQEGSPYEFNAAAGTVTADYTSVGSSDEALDAFYGNATVTVKGSMSESVTLTRPFAQLNIGTRDYDIAAKAGFTVSQAQVTVTDVSNVLNLFNGLAADNSSTTVTFNYAALPGEGENFPVSDCKYLAMNYVLVGSDAATTTVTMDLTDGATTQSSTYTGVPLRANYRTNIYGNLLTNPVDYEVTINKDFAGEMDPIRVTDEESFNNALENADANGNVTIILDGDVTLTGGLVFGSTSRANAAANVTISLGGKTLTVPGTIKLLGNASLEIIDGTLMCDAGDAAGIRAEGNSNLSLNGVTLGTTKSYLNTAIGIFDEANVSLTKSKITGENSISMAFNGNAMYADNIKPSFKLTLENVEIDVRDTAFFCNNPATVTISNCSFKSFLQAGVLRGGDYTFNGNNTFTLVPTRGKDLNTNGYAHWQTLCRGTIWKSDGNHLPSAALVVGNYTTDGNYNYPTTVNVTDGSHIYVAVEGTDTECKKFPNAIFAANQGANLGVYINQLPEVSNSVSSLNFVYTTANIFINGNEHYVYDPAMVDGWKPTANNNAAEIEINSVGNLRTLAAEVNSGNTMSKWNVALKADLDLENKSWTPIGNASYAFQGIFDGENHTISNLYINTPNNSNVGLFGHTTDGEVKNLTVNNATVKGYLEVGTVAGTPYTSKYNNITVTGNVKVDGFSYVGGMLGKNLYVSADNLTVNVNKGSYVSANSIEYGVEYRTYVGGVVGFMGEGGHKVSNVTSNIDVIGTTCDAGGITGIAHYGNKFENCVATCNVSLTNAAEALYSEIGGIAGVWHNNDGSTVTFTNCSFTGTLSSVRGDKTYDVSGNTITGSKYSATGTGELYIDGVKQN